jgi:hypothetical protein
VIGVASDRRYWTVVGAGIAALVVHLVLGITIGEEYALPTTILGLIGGTIVLRGPVGQAFARRLHDEGGSALPPEQVLGELDDLRGRLAELEERVDFSERLLVRQREDVNQGGG